MSSRTRGVSSLLVGSISRAHTNALNVASPTASKPRTSKVLVNACHSSSLECRRTTASPPERTCASGPKPSSNGC